MQEGPHNGESSLPLAQFLRWLLSDLTLGHCRMSISNSTHTTSAQTLP